MPGSPPQNLHATTIDEVIHSLDRILAWAKENRSRLGYFAALYRKVTIRVKQGIDNGEFDDNPRMERLDVIFANRYFDAFEHLVAQRQATACWSLAFDTAARWRPIVLQHFLLGMNAHIHLDLGIAANETVPPAELPGLKADFLKINAILASLVDDVQQKLTEVWPLLKLLDRIAGRLDEALANFGLLITRGRAWRVAESLAALPPEQREARIREVDAEITKIGDAILFQGYYVWLVLLLIRIMELRSVRRVIEILEAP